MTEQVLIDRLQQLVDKYYDVDFDYEQEYWDSGNYDDCYAYGVECGMNDVAEIVRRIIRTHQAGGDINNVAI